jgi:predicted dehydrogenase
MGNSKTTVPRIALVGCGAIAEFLYIPVLAKYPSILKNLILVDPDEARLQQLANRFKVKHLITDYRKVISEVLDGVIIATPTQLHYPVAMHFLSAGVHVLCEKPLTDSAKKAKEMVDLSRETGVELAANYTRRLFGSSRKIKELLNSGAIGQVLSICYFEGEEFKWPTASGFYFDANFSSKGVLLDRGAHVLDLICWWLGEKPVVILSENDSFGGCDAVAHVCLRHKNCVVDVKLSLLGKFPGRYVIRGELGSVEGGIWDYKTLVLKKKSGQRKRIKLPAKGRYYKYFGNKIVANFLDVISSEERPLVSGRDVLESMELIDDCYEIASRFDMPWYEQLEICNE